MVRRVEPRCTPESKTARQGESGRVGRAGGDGPADDVLVKVAYRGRDLDQLGEVLADSTAHDQAVEASRAPTSARPRRPPPLGSTRPAWPRRSGPATPPQPAPSAGLGAPRARRGIGTDRLGRATSCSGMEGPPASPAGTRRCSACATEASTYRASTCAIRASGSAVGSRHLRRGGPRARCTPDQLDPGISTRLAALDLELPVTSCSKARSSGALADAAHPVGSRCWRRSAPEALVGHRRRGRRHLHHRGACRHLRVAGSRAPAHRRRCCSRGLRRVRRPRAWRWSSAVAAGCAVPGHLAPGHHRRSSFHGRRGAPRSAATWPLTTERIDGSAFRSFRSESTPSRSRGPTELHATARDGLSAGRSGGHGWR